MTKSFSSSIVGTSSDTECIICGKEYEKGDKITILECEHKFHKECINKWLNEGKNICPMCK